MQNKSSSVSYVYFIQQDSKVKIGKANEPKKRLSMLQVGTPHILKLLGTIEFSTSEEASIEESILHEKYKSRNTRG